MPPDPHLELLQDIVKAYETPLPTSSELVELNFFTSWGGANLQHHSFGESEPPKADKIRLEELHSRGLIAIEYHTGNWTIVPTTAGRATIEELERAQDATARASVDGLIEAVELQRSMDNRLAWEAVRPVLGALRRYWEEAGFPPEGIGVMPLLANLPDGTDGQFRATVTSLMSGGYLSAGSELEVHGLPAFVVPSERTYAVLDGWPGASSQELAENLLAVLAERAEHESDPAERRRLRRVADTVRELGVATAGEVLAKVLTGG